MDDERRKLIEDTQVFFGDAVKFERLDEHSARLGGYLVRYSGPIDPDITGDFFTKESDLGIVEGAQLPVYYQHGMDGVLKARRLGRAQAKFDDVGLWVEAQIALRDEYEKALAKLAEEGKLGWSSGAAGHLVERTSLGKAWWVKAWPIAEASLTPEPAEPRNTVIPLKSLFSNQQGRATAGRGGPEAVGNTAASEAATQINLDIREITMKNEPNLKTVQMTAEEYRQQIAGAAKAAAEEALKAYRQGEPAVDSAGVHVQVIQDEADRPFKSIAENCAAVKTLELSKGQIADPRLRRLSVKAVLGANEGIHGEGGFLLEPALAKELIQPLHEEGPFSSRARRLPVGADSNYGWINGVDETSRATGSRWGGIRGYRLTEGESITASKPKFRRINWELKKYGVVVYATDELLRDASQFSAIVQQGAAEEINFMANDDILNGEGTGGPKGILQSGALVTVAKESGQTAATVVSENLHKMWQRMMPRHRQNAAWFINSEVEPELDNLYLTAGADSLEPRYVTYTPEGVMRIKGRPVVVNEFCAALGTVSDIVLADMNDYLFWEKGGIDQAQSIHLEFLTDQTAFRFIYRCDGQTAMNAAVTPYKGSSTQSAFVALATRS